MVALRLRLVAGAIALGLVLAHTAAYAACAADPAWFPETPPPKFTKPAPKPGPDCPFYQAAWQTYLYVTRLKNGRPAFLSYETMESLFGELPAPAPKSAETGVLTLTPRTLQAANDISQNEAKPAAVTAGVRQAGLKGLLVDQNGNPIFYAIHVNKAFAKFVRDHHLTTADGITNADAKLTFPSGAVELKSAWRVVSDANPPAGYVTTKADVPALKIVNGIVEADPAAKPRRVTVALLAVHVVFVLDGHPEFIWSTFEHVDPKTGLRDNAPVAASLPTDNGSTMPISDKDFPLYKAGTQASDANQVVDDATLAGAFVPAGQNFMKGGAPLQTSVYRLFPASKSKDAGEDEDIADLTKSVVAAPGAATDIRNNYRLVGAVWLDKPDSAFVPGHALANPDGVGTDDDGTILAGEDALSSTAMESFTQDIFPNCFSCHDTRAIKDDKKNTLIEPKLLNVSHVLSKFLSDKH